MVLAHNAIRIFPLRHYNHLLLLPQQLPRHQHVNYRAPLLQHYRNQFPIQTRQLPSKISLSKLEWMRLHLILGTRLSKDRLQQHL